MQSPANLTRAETWKVTRRLDQQRISRGDGLQGLVGAATATVKTSTIGRRFLKRLGVHVVHYIVMHRVLIISRLCLQIEGERGLMTSCHRPDVGRLHYLAIARENRSVKGEIGYADSAALFLPTEAQNIFAQRRDRNANHAGARASKKPAASTCR